jgi:hypothetical protein
VTYTRLAEGNTMGRLAEWIPAMRNRVLHLATAGEVAASGTYYDGLKPGSRVHRQANDPELAARLWERSAEPAALGAPVLTSARHAAGTAELVDQVYRAAGLPLRRPAR